MIIELNMKNFTLKDIKHNVLNIHRGGSVLVLKNFIKNHSIKDLMDFLVMDLSYQNDMRQFDYNENAVLQDWFKISYNPKKSNVYTHSNTRQPLHTDNSWFSDPAELNFFYMEKQTKIGGENTYYPLNRLKEDLQKDNKSLLDDLMSIPVVISKGDGEYFNETTIIYNNKIFWNFYRTKKTKKHIDTMCNYFFKYLEHKENSKSVEIYKSNEGDVFCFNDLTILHGRLAFTAKKKNERILYQSMWKKV